jgi:hypothetical protein
MEIQKLREFILDEAQSAPIIEALNSKSLEQLLAARNGLPDLSGRTQAIQMASWKIRSAVYHLGESEFPFGNAEPGHSTGHCARDYLNGIRLAKNVDAEPVDIMIGLIAGVMHDLAVAIIDRWQEGTRVVRHAEAAAIIALEVARDLRWHDDLAMLVAYSIAAHTHYLKEQIVDCADGVTRTIHPYIDVDADGKPLMFVWLTRWIDRLDINGPCFIGRHFLTLGTTHTDFSGTHGHYLVEFEPHMRPILRTNEEIEQQGGQLTMLEHIKRFASSQNNNSPYGKFDDEAMTRLRDPETASVLRVIDQVQEPLTEYEVEAVLQSWERFLYTMIEPSEKGREVAKSLCRRFRELPMETQTAWTSGFLQTMIDHDAWAREVTSDLAGMEAEYFSLQPISEDVRELLSNEILSSF